VTRLAAVILALTVAMPLAAAQEKWYEWYNKGVAAVRANQYREGADALQRAIAEMPAETTSARAGNVIITYVPHFWLGIARFNLGEADAALREWRISEEQGAVQNTQYFGSLREWVARANSQKQRNAESGASESRKAATAAMNRALDGQAAAVAAGGDRSDGYRAAERKLKEAFDTFAAAGTEVAAYRRATDLATQARELFTAAAEVAKKAKAARPAIVIQKSKPPEVVVPFEEKKPPVTVTTPPPAPPPVTKPEPPRVVPKIDVESEALVSARLAVQEYKRHLLDAKMSTRDALQLEHQLDGNPTDAVAQRVKGEVQQREKSLAAAKATVKPLPAAPVAPAVPLVSPLEPAWRAFAAGDLRRADELLTSLVSSSASADAYLLRGCTRWTRAALARRGDVTPATADFRAALRLNRALRLDPAVFSPKLIAFFEQVRGASR
jgi:tetratricopeptide (TPR) repeat protein